MSADKTSTPAAPRQPTPAAAGKPPTHAIPVKPSPPPPPGTKGQLPPPQRRQLPLKPPPGYNPGKKAPPARKRRHRRRRHSTCCYVTSTFAVLLLAAAAAAAVAYSYYQPQLPVFHLQSLNSTAKFHYVPAAASDVADGAVTAAVVAWNENSRIALAYGVGAVGRVVLEADGGDVEIGEAAVDVPEVQPVRTAAALVVGVKAKGVPVMGRKKEENYRVEVDVHVGARVGSVELAKLPVRIVCGAVSPAAATAAAKEGAMEKCPLYLFKLKWLSLNH